jgi:gliding motility-associated-like protein
MKKATNLLLFALFFIPANLFGQLTISPTHPAAVLAAKLAGSGISISSPVLTCPGVANGTFVSVTTPIVIDSGIVLTTGRAINTTGLETFLASTNNAAPGDPDLVTLAGTGTFDACTLEFDFVPQGDTVSFNYQFGSEEYTNSTCGQYNDAFAFFISGPGITGMQNMALVPGTNIPVTVNSINSGVPGPPGWPGFCNIANCTAMGPGSPFTTYYINNTGGTQVTYRGYTRKLRAFHQVTPCSTYHLKMSIADAANGLYDSGVFIEAGSLSTNSYRFRKNDSIGHTIAGIPNALVRGCAPATITVLNSRVTGTPQKVYFSYAGSAVKGPDYTAPDSATINPGDTSVVISITGNPATPATGIRTITIFLSSPFSCGIIDTISLNLLDAPTLSLLTPDTAICLGQSFQIRANGSAGLLYTWTPSASLSSATAIQPIATPVASTSYTVNAVLPLSGCAPLVRTVNVAVNMATMSIVTPDTTICKGDAFQIMVSGSAGLFYTWTPGATLDFANAQNPWARPLTTMTYSVTAVSVTDGCTATDQITVTVSDPIISIINPAPSICPGKQVQLLVSGDPTYSYSWEPGTGLSDPDIMEPFAGPLVATTYTVTATVPTLGCKTTSVATVTILPPVPAVATALKTVCINEPAELYATPNGVDFTVDWDGPDGFNSNLFNTFVKRATAASQGVYTAVITNTVTGCTGTDTAMLTVGGAISALFDVTANTTIKIGSSLQMNASGGRLYTWLPNDGSLNNNNINNPVATPRATTTYTVTAFDSLGCLSTDTVRVEVETGDDIFIPTAFTPNGDGLNDLFRPVYPPHYTLADLQIFDRWGNIVYASNAGGKTGWDGTYNGKNVEMGVYHYLMHFTRPGNIEKVVKGDITLIR